MKYIVAVLVLCLSAFIYFFLQQDSDLVLRFYQSFGPEPCSVLRGKVVWITGVSSGIGRQLAYDLAGCGCKLVLSARRKHKLEEVKQKCLEINPSYKHDDVIVLPLDVTSFSSHVDLANEVAQRFGHIDVLVNNAGVTQMPNYCENIPFAVERNLLDVNLLGAISLTKAVLPHMLKRQQGQIVVVNSVMGKYMYKGFSIYSTSKFGLKVYFDGLRDEVTSRNITVVNVYPGPVVSDILGNAFSSNYGVTAKDTPNYREFLAHFDKVHFMATERFTYLTMVAMANNIQESWMMPRQRKMNVYKAHYLSSLLGTIYT